MSSSAIPASSLFDTKSRRSRPRKKQSDSSRKSNVQGNKRLKYRMKGTSFSMRSQSDAKLMKLPTISMNSDNSSPDRFTSQKSILSKIEDYKIKIDAPKSTRKGSIRLDPCDGK